MRDLRMDNLAFEFSILREKRRGIVIVVEIIDDIFWPVDCE